MTTSGTTAIPDTYFAGLFDGEGSVSMSLRKDGYSTSEAARALGVTHAAVGHAKRKNGRVRGFTVEAV